jgi:transcriptional regulator with XRE-family HTH domain
METYKNIPKLSTIERIAEALNIDPLILFQDISRISPEQEVELQNKKKKILSLIEKELDTILHSEFFQNIKS